MWHLPRLERLQPTGLAQRDVLAAHRHVSDLVTELVNMDRPPGWLHASNIPGTLRARLRERDWLTHRGHLRLAEASRDFRGYLADHAGATMMEVVSSIKRVTDIMGEISAASGEQSAGVAQVGKAVSQMDRTTQQNAAAIEESAEAAESLMQQAQVLVQAVGVFKLDDGAGQITASSPRQAG